jgi:hypothetical protein
MVHRSQVRKKVPKLFPMTERGTKVVGSSQVGRNLIPLTAPFGGDDTPDNKTSFNNPLMATPGPTIKTMACVLLMEPCFLPTSRQHLHGGPQGRTHQGR